MMGEQLDPLVIEAAKLIIQHQFGSPSILQRHLELGYMKAGKIMNQLEQIGIIGKWNGIYPREILVSNEAELDTFLTFKGLINSKQDNNWDVSNVLGTLNDALSFIQDANDEYETYYSSTDNKVKNVEQLAIDLSTLIENFRTKTNI